MIILINLSLFSLLSICLLQSYNIQRMVIGSRDLTNLAQICNANANAPIKICTEWCSKMRINDARKTGAIQYNTIMMIAGCWCSEKTLVIQFQHRRRESNGDISLQFCNVSPSLKLALKNKFHCCEFFQLEIYFFHD